MYTHLVVYVGSGTNVSCVFCVVVHAHGWLRSIIMNAPPAYIIPACFVHKHQVFKFLSERDFTLLLKGCFLNTAMSCFVSYTVKHLGRYRISG